MLKNIFILFIFFILNNCGLSGTALLGPVYTGATTGSAYHTSISFGTGKVLKKVNAEINKKEIPQKKVLDQKTENKIIATLIVDKVVISEVIEPEPLP